MIVANIEIRPYFGIELKDNLKFELNCHTVDSLYKRNLQKIFITERHWKIIIYLDNAQNTIEDLLNVTTIHQPF